MLASGGMGFGLAATLAGVRLLWLGRQTRPRKT
jgi:hypothetical protein